MTECEATLIVPYRTLSGEALIPNDLAEKLIGNWRALEGHRRAVADGKATSAEEPIAHPLVRLWSVAGPYRCMISRVDPGNTNLAFGIADTGIGLPSIGYIHLEKIVALEAAKGSTLERDAFFKPKRTLFGYLEVWREEAHLRELNNQVGDLTRTPKKLIKPMPRLAAGAPAAPAAEARPSAYIIYRS